MLCPGCNNRNHNEIDLHSDGFAKDLIECSTCGTLWLDDHGQASIIKIATEQPAHRATH